MRRSKNPTMDARTANWLQLTWTRFCAYCARPAQRRGSVRLCIEQLETIIAPAAAAVVNKWIPLGPIPQTDTAGILAVNGTHLPGNVSGRVSALAFSSDID